MPHPEFRQKRLRFEFEQNSGQHSHLPTTWVVSDLRSKFEIQKLLLKKQGFYEDLQVLRASELWRMLLRRIRPDLKIISGDLIRALVRDQMESLKLPLGPSADQAICDFMDQFAPVIFHQAGAENLKEWFDKNPRSFERWGSWYRMAEQFAQYFLDRRWIAPAWVSSVLFQEIQNFDDVDSIWSRELVFDLGCELTQTESDLIQWLARGRDCEVLKPTPPTYLNFESLLSSYEQLPVETKVKRDLEAVSLDRIEKTFRFSGMLAEVKHAVAQARSWLDSGISPHEIAILAPDIEAYWPALAEFMEIEGLPVQKERTSRLQSIPVVHQWIANIRIRAGGLDNGQLQVAIYGPEMGPGIPLRFEEFEALFANLLGPEDLARSSAIQKYFGQGLNSKKSMRVEEFLGCTLPYWTRKDLSEILEVLIKDLLQKSSVNSEMRLSNWLFFLERLISKKEIRLKVADNQGIVVANFSDGESLFTTHRLFLGLSQSQLKAKSISWILPSEINSFNRDHGFYLMDPEASRATFELEWLRLGKSTEDHYCFPGTQWDGSIETPSQFWMEVCVKEKGTEGIHMLQNPEKTRWDEIQDDVARVNLPQNSGQMSLQKEKNLSASSLQRFRDCPFIFFSEKVLELKDPPEVDLDLDRRTKGQLIHGVLEKMMGPEKFLVWTAQDIRELLEEEKKKFPPGFVHEGLWGPLREKHVTLALKFQDQEKLWHQKYPLSKVIAREQKFEFSFEGMRFKGVIDRLDGDDQRLVVLDYKTTDAQLKTFNKWFDENQLQLGFYSWLLEKGYVAELGARQVVGAFFYILKNLDRSSGFKTSEGEGLLDVQRKKAHITQETKLKFYADLETEIRKVIAQIRKGDFLPKPRELDICERCQWRGLCRAPHLI